MKSRKWKKIKKYGAIKLPNIPLNSFPVHIRKMIEETSKSYGVCPNLPAIHTIGVYSVAAAKVFKIRIKPDWNEPANLYLIAPLLTGERKSAVLDEMFRPITNWELDVSERMRNEIEQANIKRSNEEAIIAGKKTRLGKKNSDDEVLQNEIQELSAKLTKVPKPPLLIANDITPEVTVSLLKENNERLGLVDDEGGLFDAIAGRYNGIPNFDVFLKGYSNSGNVKTFRKGSSESTILNNPVITFCISPQPSVVRDLVKIPGAVDKGFLARFLYCYPTPSGLQTWTTDRVSKEVRSAYSQKIRQLLEFAFLKLNEEGFSPISIRFDSEALQEFQKFWVFVAKERLPGGTLNEVAAWAKKLSGSTARIILLLHIMKFFDESEGVSKNKINLKTTQEGIAIAHALINHGKFAFEDMAVDQTVKSAKVLLEWIKSEKIKAFCKRDCQSNFRTLFKKAKDVDPALEELERRGYVKRDNEISSGKVGRKSEEYIVNPEMFKE